MTDITPVGWLILGAWSAGCFAAGYFWGRAHEAHVFTKREIAKDTARAEYFEKEAARLRLVSKGLEVGRVD